MKYSSKNLSVKYDGKKSDAMFSKTLINFQSEFLITALT